MDVHSGSTGGGLAPLGLSTVLVSTLPRTLLTEDAPAHYAVDAVFDRRPEEEEIAAILSDDTRDALADLGYPGVGLEVSDRRLRISGTNLEELRDGLAGVIAQKLSDLSGVLRARRDADLVRLRQTTEKEEDRAAHVEALAASVRFVARRKVLAHPEPDPDEESHVSDWIEEGGSAR